MELFQRPTPEEASAFFDAWYENVMKSNIAPMKKVAKTLKYFKQEIIAIIKHNITNAAAERLNGEIQKLNPESFRDTRL